VRQRRSGGGGLRSRRARRRTAQRASKVAPHRARTAADGGERRMRGRAHLLVYTAALRSVRGKLLRASEVARIHTKGGARSRRGEGALTNSSTLLPPPAGARRLMRITSRP
jgi:hypothetical protein